MELNLNLSKKQVQKGGAIDKILSSSNDGLNDAILANLVGAEAIELADLALKNPDKVRKIISSARKQAMAPKKNKWN